MDYSLKKIKRNKKQTASEGSQKKPPSPKPQKKINLNKEEIKPNISLNKSLPSVISKLKSTPGNPIEVEESSSFTDTHNAEDSMFIEPTIEDQDYMDEVHAEFKKRVFAHGATSTSTFSLGL